MVIGKRNEIMVAKLNNSAIIERLKSNAKRPIKAAYQWIRFAKASGEIAEALSCTHEIAQMTLFGLVATGNVRALDAAKHFIDLDECTIAELEGKPAYIAADELRDWLKGCSTAPLPNRRNAVIAQKLDRGEFPGRNVAWKKFCDGVRNECNGWRSKGRPAHGFSDKQIQRAVKEIGLR
jgi:hypothetical protein